MVIFVFKDIRRQRSERGMMKSNMSALNSWENTVIDRGQAPDLSRHTLGMQRDDDNDDGSVDTSCPSPAPPRDLGSRKIVVHNWGVERATWRQYWFTRASKRDLFNEFRLVSFGGRWERHRTKIYDNISGGMCHTGATNTLCLSL